MLPITGVISPGFFLIFIYFRKNISELIWIQKKLQDLLFDLFFFVWNWTTLKQLKIVGLVQEIVVSLLSC